MFAWVVGIAAVVQSAITWMKLKTLHAPSGAPALPAPSPATPAPSVAPGEPSPSGVSAKDPHRGVLARVDPEKEPALATNTAMQAHVGNVLPPYDFYVIGKDEDSGLFAAYLNDVRLPRHVDSVGQDVIFALTGSGILSTEKVPVPGPGQMPRVNDDVIVDVGANDGGTMRVNVESVRPLGNDPTFNGVGEDGRLALLVRPDAVLINFGPNDL